MGVLVSSLRMQKAVVTRSVHTRRGGGSDADGVSIHYLLHVVDGMINELEVYKDDSSRVRRQVQPEELTVMNVR